MKKLIDQVNFTECVYSTHELEELKSMIEMMGVRMLRCCHLPEAYFQELETYLCNLMYRIVSLEKKPDNLEAYCYIGVRNSIYEMLKHKKEWNSKHVKIEQAQ